MTEIMLYIIAIFIIYRIATRNERRQKRYDKLVWFLAKRKLKRLQGEGKLNSSIDLDSIKDVKVEYK